MPRILPLTVQSLLESGEGIDPIMVIGISFGNTEQLYSDRDLGDPRQPSVLGKILDFGQLEDVTRIDGNGSAASISFKLSDTDGSIKALLDNTDVIFRKVVVYQYFNELALGDMVRLFEGVLSSPIEWDEGTRSVQLTAITRQSNFQIGFSLDESQTPVYHQDLLNKPWPMIFGSPRYTPTLPLQEVPVGFILNAFVLPDPSIDAQVLSLTLQMNQISSENPGIEPEQSGIVDSFGNTYSTFEDMEEFLPQYYAWVSRQLERIDAIKLQIADLKSQQAQQYEKWLPHNMIVGGFRFPQGTPLICKINERTFKIVFLGGNTVPTNPEQPCPAHLEIYESPYQFTPLSQQTPQQQAEAAAKAARSQANAVALGLNNSAAQLQALIDSTPFEIPRAGAEFFEEGSQVELLDNLPGGYHHVASITPGTVQGVYAYRVQNGYRRLAQVPPKYYSLKTEPLGTQLRATYIVMKRPLSTISYFDNQVTTPYDIKILNLQQQQGQLGVSKLTNKIEWEDDIYVNFVSMIGPNVIDIMIWLISHYTLYSYDLISFARVRDNQINYPANFCLTNRPVVDSLLQDIAYQCRCAMWIKNGTYYIKYLPDDPIITSTIDDSDIDFGSLSVGSSSTDNIITKYIATWKVDGLHDDARIVVKNNVEKYGILEESHDYFIYNNYNLVLKSATFWTIRRSNVWKIVKCKLHLDKLDIETLDDVNLDLSQPYVTSNSNGVACQVESCQYDSVENLITVQLWTGIKIGEMEAYPFARPANMSSNVLFPLYSEQHTGAVPSIPSERWAPLVPFYNQLQSHVVTYQQYDKVADSSGFIAGNRASVLGDPFPSDQGDVFVEPTSLTLNYVGTTRPDNTYTYDKIPGPLVVSAVPDILAKAFPGRVWAIGDDGTTWQVDMYPNGLDGAFVRKFAKEGHGDPELRGIEGEWVSVYRIVRDQERNYCFFSQHTMAFPINMTNKILGDIYMQGTAGPSVTDMPVSQIQIAGGFEIPSNTWTIGVRVWDGNTAKYEVQVPVWLPRT